MLSSTHISLLRWRWHWYNVVKSWQCYILALHFSYTVIASLDGAPACTQLTLLIKPNQFMTWKYLINLPFSSLSLSPSPYRAAHATPQVPVILTRSTTQAWLEPYQCPNFGFQPITWIPLAPVEHGVELLSWQLLLFYSDYRLKSP